MGKPRSYILVVAGTILILSAPLARLLPYGPLAVRPYFEVPVAVLGAGVLILWQRGRVRSQKANKGVFDSLSTDHLSWRLKLESIKNRPEAFKYFQTKYFHQDRLMWGRLPLFFATQAATLSVGLTADRRLTACVAVAAGLVFGLWVFDLFIEDDKFRCAARTAMEEMADHVDLKVPIVGMDHTYFHPAVTRRILFAILLFDVGLYVVCLIATHPLLVMRMGGNH